MCLNLSSYTSLHPCISGSSPVFVVSVSWFCFHSVIWDTASVYLQNCLRDVQFFFELKDFFNPLLTLCWGRLFAVLICWPFPSSAWYFCSLLGLFSIACLHFHRSYVYINNYIFQISYLNIYPVELLWNLFLKSFATRFSRSISFINVGALLFGVPMTSPII